MAKLFILSVLFFCFSHTSFANKIDCIKNQKVNAYNKYRNKFADNFQLYYKEDKFLLKVDQDFYSNDPDLVKLCNGVVLLKNIDRVILMSSTLLEVFRELGEVGLLVGMAEKKYVYENSRGLSHVEDLGSVPITEKVLALKPNLIIGYRSPALNSFYKKVSRLGVPVFFIDDFKLGHPLARAEMRVVVGSLLGRINDSIKQFDHVVHRYSKFKKLVTSKKRVLLGEHVNSGAWKLVNRGSDFYKIVKDAGGLDLFEHFKERNINPEEVLKLKDKIDHWLPQASYQSVTELKRESNFLNIFLKVTTFKISTYAKKVNKYGGSEFWDVAMMRPDILLNDLINVLGTSRLSDEKKTRWYQVIR